MGQSVSWLYWSQAVCPMCELRDGRVWATSQLLQSRFCSLNRSSTLRPSLQGTLGMGPAGNTAVQEVMEVFRLGSSSVLFRSVLSSLRGKFLEGAGSDLRSPWDHWSWEEDHQRSPPQLLMGRRGCPGPRNAARPSRLLLLPWAGHRHSPGQANSPRKYVSFLRPQSCLDICFASSWSE